MSDFWQADSTMPSTMPAPAAAGRAAPAWHAFARGPIAKESWLGFAYLLVNAPLGLLGFGYTVVLIVGGIGTAITFLGLPIIALTVLGGRQFGRLYRTIGRRMVGARVDDPAPFRRRPGLLGWLSSALSDATGWRALAYLILKFPLTIVGTYGAVLFWSEAVLAFLYPVWWTIFDPTNVDPHGVRHHSGVQIGSMFFDTWPEALLVSAIGLVAIFLAPWPVRGVVAFDGVLMRWLLGPTKSSDRVHELERTRARAVDDSATALRRIERDLHDGTQARLVALAMSLGQAKETLDETGDPSRVRQLVGSAHDSAKDAIAELRDLVRGIHPPVLDQGLDAALATLAARCAVPVELRARIPHRPSPAIETIAYFCVAELLTNVVRHSGATRAVVEAREHGGTLRLQVSDDGRGGARVGTGTGLTGLAERVRTVDGRLTVDSPDSGPTVISVVLPMGS
jgi:signal transduction histidine kinase